VGRGQRTPARLVLRPKITSLAAEGHDNSTLPPRSTRVGKPWVSGVTASPPSGCLVSPRNAPRGGQPPKMRQALTVRLLKTTDHPPKPPAATPWSTRTVARYLPTPPRLCNEPRPAIGVQPYRVRAVTLSQDPHFQDKLEDVVGLCLPPPEHTMILCVDEKSQIQATHWIAPSQACSSSPGAAAR
jgi:hypothetical protein